MAPSALPTLHVRDARPGDGARFAEIYNQAIRAGRSTMDTEPVTAAHFETLLRELAPVEALLAGEAAGGVVAWGVVKRYSDRPGYGRACETSLYVAEEASGRGHGSVMLPLLLERARSLGHHHVVAKIMAVNEASVRFHQRFGFEIVGRQREIGRLAGRWHDVVILQHLLD